jgi:hypothetical protein
MSPHSGTGSSNTTGALPDFQMEVFFLKKITNFSKSLIFKGKKQTRHFENTGRHHFPGDFES